MDIKIITANVKVSQVKDMAKLVGKDKLYCSRSELIRSIVKAKLKEILRELNGPMMPEIIPEVEMVKIPYKILKVLESTSE